MDDKGGAMSSLVDEQFLQAMGLSALPDGAKEDATESILYNLNLAVARRISSQLREEQLDSFEAMMHKDGAKEETQNWLKQNVPNYAQIVEEEVHRLREDSHSTVNRIMAKKRAEHDSDSSPDSVANSGTDDI